MVLNPLSFLEVPGSLITPLTLTIWYSHHDLQLAAGPHHTNLSTQRLEQREGVVLEVSEQNQPCLPSLNAAQGVC